MPSATASCCWYLIIFMSAGTCTHSNTHNKPSSPDEFPMKTHLQADTLNHRCLYRSFNSGQLVARHTEEGDIPSVCVCVWRMRVSRPRRKSREVVRVPQGVTQIWRSAGVEVFVCMCIRGLLVECRMTLKSGGMRVRLTCLPILASWLVRASISACACASAHVSGLCASSHESDRWLTSI